MKRNIKFICLLIPVLVFVASCKDDFLAEKRDFGGVNEEVFQDALTAKAYVDYIYGLFLPANNATSMISTNSASENGTYNTVFSQTTEELAGETDYNKVWAQISYTNNHANKYFGQRMSTSINNNSWTRIKQINIFLSEIDKHGLPEQTRNELKGQMYFWRAWQYFELVRLFGGVPLVLEPQNPILSEGSGSEVPRSKTSECIEQICADLDLAATLLPGKWGNDDWGRITSGAAAALKGRVLLTWASPLFNPTEDVARWERSYQANAAAKSLLEANGFGLFKTGGTANATAWENMFLAEVGNPEAVIVFNFNTVNSDQVMKFNGWEQAIRPKEISGGGSVSPTKQMLDAFPMKDGKPAGESPNYTYSLNKFYKDRDPRFYKTFAYNGAIWPYKDDANFKVWSYTWKKKATDANPTATTETRGANSSGIYLRKASNPAASNSLGDFKISGTNFMEMRFAEVVLNLAESAIGSGKLAEGLEGIKSIRERAGVENLDGNFGLADVAGDKDKLFAAVINERKIEFAYEGKRFFDLRRWKLFEEGSPTAARLGVKPLNGTRRTGLFISVKTSTGADYVNDKVDPLIKPATGKAAVIDRSLAVADYPAGVTTYQGYVDYLYENHFKVTERDDLDRTNPADWKFKWYPEYYFFGLNQTVLSGSPYLEQTTNWNSLNGMGTFDPLK